MKFTFDFSCFLLESFATYMRNIWPTTHVGHVMMISFEFNLRSDFAKYRNTYPEILNKISPASEIPYFFVWIWMRHTASSSLSISLPCPLSQGVNALSFPTVYLFTVHINTMKCTLFHQTHLKLFQFPYIFLLFVFNCRLVSENV